MVSYAHCFPAREHRLQAEETGSTAATGPGADGHTFYPAGSAALDGNPTLNINRTSYHRDWHHSFSNGKTTRANHSNEACPHNWTTQSPGDRQEQIYCSEDHPAGSLGTNSAAGNKSSVATNQY